MRKGGGGFNANVLLTLCLAEMSQDGHQMVRIVRLEGYPEVNGVLMPFGRIAWLGFRTCRNVLCSTVSSLVMKEP